MKETTRREKRDRITEAARRCFVTRGYSAVSMDDLARELGMGKGTLYRYFPSKEALFLEVIGRESAKIGAAVGAIVDDASLRFPEKLRAFLRYMTAALSAYRPDVLQELHRTLPQAYEKIMRLRQELILQTFGELFAQGKRSGVCREDVDETLVAHMVIGTLRQVFEAGVPLPGAGLDRLFRSILSVILRGCLTDAGRESLG